MVLLAYLIEKKALYLLLLAQLAQEQAELSCYSASFIKEVQGRILNCFHLFALNIGEDPQVVAGALLSEDHHVLVQGGGDEAG